MRAEEFRRVCGSEPRGTLAALAPEVMKSSRSSSSIDDNSRTILSQRHGWLVGWLVDSLASSYGNGICVFV